MKKLKRFWALLAVVAMIPLWFLPWDVSAAEEYIYDRAGILTAGERAELEALAEKTGKKHETDLFIVTVNEPGVDVKQYTEDFYDDKIAEKQLDKWNVVVLTLDMYNREVYLAGFYKGELYLDDHRLDKVREQITLDLSAGQFARAFEQFIAGVDHYMSGEPANIFFQWWFQILLAITAGVAVTGLLLYQSGGKTMVNSRTYLDPSTSRILARKDEYIRSDITRMRKPTEKPGGGGITGGGHSHSGSRGSF